MEALRVVLRCCRTSFPTRASSSRPDEDASIALRGARQLGLRLGGVDASVGPKDATAPATLGGAGTAARGAGRARRLGGRRARQPRHVRRRRGRGDI